jgi:hypothetical protein
MDAPAKCAHAGTDGSVKRFAILSFDAAGNVLAASTCFVDGVSEAVRHAPVCAPLGARSQKIIGHTNDVPAGDLDAMREILGPLM